MYRDRTVCVIVPAYNEAPSIGRVLDAMPDFVDHIVVVDDGSGDGTGEIAKNRGVIVMRHTRNRGVGAAFHTGLKKALEFDADVTVNVDADGQFDPHDIVRLVDPVIDGEADFVTASRFVDKTLVPEMPRVKYWGNLAMSRLISFLTGQRFHDVSCGFRAYSREALLRLNLLGKFTYTQETFLDLAFKDLAIKEIPVVVRGVREKGESKVANNLFRYGYRTLTIIFRAFRDYKPLRFFGIIAMVLVVSGLCLEVFLFIYYLKSGRFSPYKFVGITGAFFIGMGALVMITGLLADMFQRIRLNQEETLYHLKRHLYRRPQVRNHSDPHP